MDLIAPLEYPDPSQWVRCHYCQGLTGGLMLRDGIFRHRVECPPQRARREREYLESVGMTQPKENR